MTKSHINGVDNETLSALLDGEFPLNDEVISSANVATFGRYALIGDAMRAKQHAHNMDFDISQSIAQAIESEAVYADFKQKESVATQPINTNQDSKIVVFNWRKPLAQLAIAASVATFTIVGINTLPQGESSPHSEIPLLQTTPLTGMASPVSYSSAPALENAEQGLRELQQQRIGALVLEHQRQSRVAHSLKSAKTLEQPQEEKN